MRTHISSFSYYNISGLIFQISVRQILQFKQILSILLNIWLFSVHFHNLSLYIYWCSTFIFQNLSEIILFLGDISSFRNNFRDDLQNFSRHLPLGCWQWWKPWNVFKLCFINCCKTFCLFFLLNFNFKYALITV